MLADMRTRKSEIPENSRVKDFLPVDYTDAFVCETGYCGHISPDDVMVAFLTDMPGWVNALFRMRDFFAGLVGLKGAKGGSAAELESCIRTGSRYRFVSVPLKTPRETVMLLQDRHLDAYISVFADEGKDGGVSVWAVTLVRYNKFLGLAYFFLIRPFHSLIVRRMIKRSVVSAIRTGAEAPEDVR